jgi:uncharacterized protein
MDPLRLDLSHLWALAADRFALGPHSLHGPDHWQRVERNGLQLAAESGADVLVVRLFAVLHDSNRLNEVTDPEHGSRAAAWATELRREGRIDVTDAQFALLTEACVYHDKGRVSGDATIGTCWDADRLDLPRVGITPAERFMSTAAGKRLARDAGTRGWWWHER